MNRYFMALSLVAAIAGLYVPATARADFRDYNTKAWAQQGRSSSRSGMRSRPMVRSTAPVIVRTESAPNAVAQAPTEQRSFSYEPSQPTVSVGSGCGGTAATDQAPATAERSTETRRSFSYEPSMSGSDSTPRMQSGRSSRSLRTPAYLLPKTDPRKYSGRL
jgi:hypothetical protein